MLHITNIINLKLFEMKNFEKLNNEELKKIKGGIVQGGTQVASGVVNYSTTNIFATYFDLSILKKINLILLNKQQLNPLSIFSQ